MGPISPHMREFLREREGERDLDCGKCLHVQLTGNLPHSIASSRAPSMKHFFPLALSKEKLWLTKSKNTTLRRASPLTCKNTTLLLLYQLNVTFFADKKEDEQIV